MTPAMQIAAMAAAGAAAGAAFFGALGWTVAKLDSAANPALLVFGSFVLRFGLLLAGVAAIAANAGWAPLLAAAAGFSLARFSILRSGWPRFGAGSDR